MKRLKRYKAFISESYREEPKFFRFSNVDLLGGRGEAEFAPVKKKMIIGSYEYNDILVSLGFPDNTACVHFMDERAFDPSYKNLYGKNIYRIKIDDESKIGWSFFFPVNDWYYKGYPFHNAAKKSSDIQDFERKTDFGSFSHLSTSEEELINMAKLVMENGFIGTGTLKDLMESRFWGKEAVFVWTSDKVIVSKYEGNKKAPTPYKNKPALAEEDFLNRGIEKSRIAEFYQAPQGKKMRAIKTEDFSLKRTESLRLLDEWIANLSK